MLKLSNINISILFLGFTTISIVCTLESDGFQYSRQLGDVEYDGSLSIKLKHTLENFHNGEFIDRGVVDIRSIRTGAVALQQTSLQPSDRNKLKESASTDGIYRLRSIVRGADGKETTFLTWTKACFLVESNLTDIITVSLDYAGSVIAVSLSTPVAVCKGLDASDDDLRFFNTTVYVKHMEQGPIPDTATYIQKLEKERESRERGETKDNRSFLAKYWMYIVPVVIFMLLSGAANPEGPAGNGGGGGR